MSAKAISGVDGSFTLAGYNLRVSQWSANINRDVHDVTGFGMQWREFVGGVRSMSGTANGYLLFNAASTAPNAIINVSNVYDGATFTLTAYSGTLGTCTFTGTAMVTVFATGTDINGAATASIGFVATGPVTENWDQTP